MLIITYNEKFVVNIVHWIVFIEYKVTLTYIDHTTIVHYGYNDENKYTKYDSVCLTMYWTHSKISIILFYTHYTCLLTEY